jgi:hypothetical protein
VKFFERLPFLLLLLAAVGCREIHTEKFEGVHRAAKTLETSIALGVTNPKLRELVQGLSAEISIVRDKVNTERERALVEEYEQASAVYLDSLQLWDIQNEQNAKFTQSQAEWHEKWDAIDMSVGIPVVYIHRDPDSIYVCKSDRCSADEIIVARIVRKYNLPISTHTYRGNSWDSISATSSLHNLWKVGDDKLQSCNVHLNASRQKFAVFETKSDSTAGAN